MSGSNLELWKATYDAETQDQLNDAYKLWCTDYDRDCVQGMGYVGPMTACRMLDTYLESPESPTRLWSPCRTRGWTPWSRSSSRPRSSTPR